MKKDVGNKRIGLGFIFGILSFILILVLLLISFVLLDYFLSDSLFPYLFIINNTLILSSFVLSVLGLIFSILGKRKHKFFIISLFLNILDLILIIYTFYVLWNKVIY